MSSPTNPGRAAATSSFNPDKLESKIDEEVKKIRDLDADVADFRILAVLQISILSGNAGLLGKKLLNIQYPIKNLGAYKQLKGVSMAERYHVLQHILDFFNLNKFGCNSAILVPISKRYWMISCLKTARRVISIQR